MASKDAKARNGARGARVATAVSVDDVDLETPQRVAAYLRVSTDEQARSGLGLDAQLTRCRAMAAVKGWPVPVVYKDEGLSGTRPPAKRPALARLLADVEKRRVQAVIFYSLDRLGRKIRMVLELVEFLDRYDVATIFCREGFDTKTPMGRFGVAIMAAMAELERDLISERTRVALSEAGKRTGDRGGFLPYGYVRTSDGPAIAPDTYEVVQDIFVRRRAGQSLAKIADALNERSVPTTQGGKRWYPSTVKAILDNEAIYAGGVRGESHMRWPQIIAAADAPPTVQSA